MMVGDFLCTMIGLIGSRHLVLSGRQTEPSQVHMFVQPKHLLVPHLEKTRLLFLAHVDFKKTGELSSVGGLPARLKIDCLSACLKHGCLDACLKLKRIYMKEVVEENAKSNEEHPQYNSHEAFNE